MTTLGVLFKTVRGLEELASQEILEKLSVIKLILFPYGPRGWIKCEIEDYSLKDVERLRSIIEAHVILREEEYDEGFSIDHFADAVVKEIPVYAPHARRITVSAYSSHRKPSQKEIQGALAKRIVKELNAECNLKNYDTALRITLLRRVALATINLEIQPGNMPKKLETHPTPILPPIAYCMVRLASPHEGEQLLDPMCGCGTIPCMAALEWKNLRATGSDISSTYISCAKRNAETLEVADRVNFMVSDVTELADKGVEADIIAVNPPYGIALPTQSEVGKLCNAIFDLAYKVLSQQGRIIIVTPYPQLVEKAADKKKFQITNTYGIREGELPRTIQIIKKLE
nr:methyltransferase [Candidatus Freyarchaeota archaeon]